MAKIYHGKQAVKKVEEQIGRPLSYIEKRIVEEEGYAEGEYKDTKGFITSGVGQINEYKNKSFEETVAAHVKEAKRLIPNLDQFPEEVQAELIQATYRGDIGESPKAIKKLNEGDFTGFAEEFLNNDEYRSDETSQGIKKRMEKVASSVASLGATPPPIADTPYPEVTDRYAMDVLAKPNTKNKEAVKSVQKLIGAEADGIWGPKSQAMFELYNKQVYNNTVNPISDTPYREEQMPTNIAAEPTGLENPVLAVKNWWNSL